MLSRPGAACDPRHSHFQHHWHCSPTSSLVSCSVLRTSFIPTYDAIHIDEAHGCLCVSQPAQSTLVLQPGWLIDPMVMGTYQKDFFDPVVT